MQHTRTSELATFVTYPPTGRRAVGTLLRHFRRMCSTHPGSMPIVQLRAGGFQHRDTRVGWVATPMFVVVGRHPPDGAAEPDPNKPDPSKPDQSMAASLDDEIPLFNV